MVVSFEVCTDSNDTFRVVLSSGKDAFFTAAEAIPHSEIEIVEIDLERISGTRPATLKTLMKIAEGIADFFNQDDHVILYYYCDDTSDIPSGSSRHTDIWPQEYRSQLFSRMFQRQVVRHALEEDIVDVIIRIQQGDRPVIMHLIARAKHKHYVETLQAYIMHNYGK